MKILFTLNRLIELTGSELYTYDLIKELLTHDFKIDVVTNFGGKIYEDLKDSVSFFSFENPPNENYDLLHVMHPAPTQFILQIFPNKPIISTIHGMTPFEQPVYIDQIDHFIAVGPEVKKHLIDKFFINSNKISVIPNGIDLNRFKPRKNNIDIQSKIKTILWPSTIDYLRVTLLERFIHTVAKRDDYELIVLGVGEYREYLKSIAKPLKNIIFDKPTWEIEQFYNKCDITAGYIFGRVIIESLACGKAGLVCLADGSAEFVRRNNFKKVHQLQLAEKQIENVLDDYDESCYKDSRKIAEEHFDLAKNVKRIINLYKHI